MPATAQQDIAIIHTSASTAISAETAPWSTREFSSSRPIVHTAVPFTPAAALGGNDWMTSLNLGVRPTADLSDSACMLVQDDAVFETPGGGVGTQPLITRAMLREALTRQHMVKMAHEFVPGQPLPDAPSYVPLTSRQKFESWAKHTYSADMFVGTMFDAAILQASGAYPDYRGGVAGYGQRYATALISAEASSLFGRWLFPTLLHQDPRYFPSKQTNAFDRMAYAASRAIITRSDDGRNVLNTSLILSLLFSSALANGYKPNYDESFKATLANSAAGLGAAAQMHLLDEFWPDLKRILIKAEPDKMKQAQNSATDSWDDFSSKHLNRKHGDD